MLDRETLTFVGQKIQPHLDERLTRLLAGTIARACGRGGVSAVASAWDISRNTVIDGTKEIDSGAVVTSRIRRPGAGRKRIEDTDPEILAALDGLVEPTERGDPMCPLRWTTKSLRTLSGELTRLGHTVAPDTVASLLRYLGYSLQAPSKTLEGKQHSDRDAQFHYINDTAKAFLNDSQPVISVDTKKKELVGNYSNTGQEYRPQGEKRQVNGHDFPDPEVPKAIPYGIYDMFRNEGWVSVGDHNDTAQFAIASIRSWWQNMGRTAYPDATRLMITADCGGSNAARSRLFKVELATFVADTGLEITLCHFPPGTSKWNKIEHRLFSHISMNWKAHPLESLRTIVELIGATTTRTGLKVKAERDNRVYPTGIKVTDKELAAVPLTRHEFHGDWNYTIRHTPRRTPQRRE